MRQDQVMVENIEAILDRGDSSHVETLIIHKLDFNQKSLHVHFNITNKDRYVRHCTKFMNYKCFDMKSVKCR